MSKEALRYSILYLLSSLGLTSKKVELDVDSIEVLDTDGFSIYLNIASTNNVIELTKNSKKMYFRECKEVMSKRQFVEKLILDFSKMTGIHIEQMVSVKSVRKFLNMGELGDKSASVYKYLHNHNVNQIGLIPCGDNSVDLSKVDFFIHYAWGEVISFWLNRHCGNFQLYNYNRARCQYELYKLFGVERLISTIKLGKIKLSSGKWIVGSIMEDAMGISPNDISDDKIKDMTTVQLAEDLTTMNIMDALCSEGDHRPDNYMLKIENDKIVSVCSFDNDSPLSFFLTSSIGRTSMDTCEIVNNAGKINREQVDMDFLQRVKNVTREQVKECARSYLSSLQLYFLLKRFDKIKSAVINTIGDKSCSITEGPTYISRLQEWNDFSRKKTREVFKIQHKLAKLNIKL